MKLLLLLMTFFSQDIINLTRIAANDGGAQTACSFLQGVSQLANPHDYCVVAFKDTSAGNLAVELGFDCILVGRHLPTRINLDLACQSLFKRRQLCFTFHGSPWFASKNYLVNVSGVADSNLFYPEIRFWNHCSIPRKWMKFVKDRGRMFGYSRADFWVFETDTLAQRAVLLAGYPQERVTVVRMSASSFVSPERVREATRRAFKEQIGEGFSLLFMAGPNPNKRIVRIGPAIAEIRSRNWIDTPVRVVTTLDPQSGYYRTLKREFRRLNVLDAWTNLGVVPYDRISSLIDACDVVCLFSVLESFSSNMTESWAMNKPLLVCDTDWARSACGKAAIYVSPEDATSVASAVVDLMHAETRARLLANYTDHFRTYPSPAERCSQYLECMEKARQMGWLSYKGRKVVRKLFCRQCI